MAKPRKQPTERIIEALTWASVVIWLGFAFIAHILNYVWLVMLVLSVILLSSAIYQRSRNWETSLSIWVFGIWMAVFSVLETVNQMIKLMNDGNGLEIDIAVYLGIALVSMGVASVFNMISPSDVVGSSTASRRPTDYGRDYDYAPRRVDQGSVTSAYMPPAQDSARYSSGRSPNNPPDYGRDYDPGYDRAGGSRARQYARQMNDPFDRAPGYDTGSGEYAEYRDPHQADPYRDQRQPVDPYRDPRQPADPRYAGAGYYEEPAPRDPRRARPADGAGWGAQSYPTQERISRQRGRGHSQPQRSPQRQPPRAPQQPAPPQPQSSNLESRVEDIIRRSRSQRSGTVPQNDDLPY